MKIDSVSYNNRKQSFEIETEGRLLSLPYVKAMPYFDGRITVSRVWVDEEIASEGFSFLYGSDQEETVHVEQVLEYNNDPTYLRESLVYNLTIEAQKRIKVSRLGRREIIRRLGTSPAQLYRLLDQKNVQKTIDRLVELLAVLDYVVELTVSERFSEAEILEFPQVQQGLTESVLGDPGSLGYDLNRNGGGPLRSLAVAAGG